MSLTAPAASAAELADQIDPAPVLASEIAFAGRVWDVRRDEVDLGDQGTVTRDYVDHPGAVVALALREDRGEPEVLLIRQYRHPIGAHEWELPAGLLDISGEPPWLAAARELAEEADLVASRWDLLAEYVASPGGLSEALRIYLARDLSDVPERDRHPRSDEEAGIVPRWALLSDALDAVQAGRIRNAAAVIGLLALDRVLASGGRGLRAVDEPWAGHPGRRASAIPDAPAQRYE